MNEFLIYGQINSYTSSEFITSMNEADGDITVRINSGGGEPDYGWGMVAKFKEYEGKKTVKIDGKAYSMGAYIAMYADNVEALDVSTFMVHRAAYDSWFEGSEYFTKELKENLTNINKSLEAAFRARVDVEKFETLKDVKVKDIFSMEDRIDVFLTAKDAKKIGLVSKIIKITPKKAAEINSQVKIAASTDSDLTVEAPEQKPTKQDIQTQTNTKMNKSELREKHPELFAEIVGLGVEQEQERVSAWAKWSEIDPALAMKGIEGKDEIKASNISEFQVAALKAVQKKGVEDDSTEDVKLDDDGKDIPTSELSASEKLEAQMNADLTERGLLTSKS